jgi:chromate transport protein ChrA
MELIENLSIIVVNLTFVAADMLFLMILLKIAHDRWQIPCIEPILTAVRPLMGAIMNWFASVVLKATGKSYPEKTLLVLLIISLLVVRMIIMEAM